MLTKLKEFVKIHQEEIILFIGVVLISLLSFAAGYIAAKQQEKEPIQFEMTNDQFPMTNKIPNFELFKFGHWALEFGIFS